MSTKITFSVGNYQKVTIEVEREDLNIWEVRDELLRPMLLALTYQPETVAEIFPNED